VNLTVPQAAVVLGISKPRVRQLLKTGRIPGAEKFGRDWIIPEAGLDAVRVRPFGRKIVCDCGKCNTCQCRKSRRKKRATARQNESAVPMVPDNAL